jgi:hypothetical protein
MEKPKHDKIWLRPGYWDGYATWLWCEDIAPFIDDEEDEADGPYIHADVLRKLVEEEKPLGRGVNDMTREEVRDRYKRLYAGCEKLLDTGADYQGKCGLKKTE